MTTPSHLSINMESEQYITPGEQMIQMKPMLPGDDDDYDSDHYSLVLDSQHTIKSGLTMETFLRTPTSKSAVIIDRYAKHSSTIMPTTGMHTTNKAGGGKEKKKRSSRRHEYEKLVDDRIGPQHHRRSHSPATRTLHDHPHTGTGSCNPEERSRRRRSSSFSQHREHHEEAVAKANDLPSNSASDPNRKKERKKHTTSKEVKRSRSTDGSAGSSSKEGRRRSQRKRSSSLVTTSKQEERESHKHRSKPRTPQLIPSNDEYPRIPDLDLDSKNSSSSKEHALPEASESFPILKRLGGLQRTSSVPDLKPNTDAVFYGDESTLKRLSTKKSRSMVSSIERSSGIAAGRSSYMPSLSPIHSEASSPVEDIVEKIRKQLEEYASSHAPSQTQDVMVRMRLALDAMTSLVDDSSRTEIRTNVSRSRSNSYSLGQQAQAIHPFGFLHTSSEVVHRDNASSVPTPVVCTTTTDSCSSSTSGTSSRNHDSFVRRWLPRQTSERIHRTLSRGRSDSTTANNNNNNNVPLPLPTSERLEVRQVQQELDQIQQRLEHDLDRLYHKWDELQQKQREFRRRSPARF